jgi:glutaminyl-peptide cyclotransferase
MNRKIWIAILGVVAITACDKKNNKSIYFVSPEEGSNITVGKNLTLKIDAEPGSFDSVQYVLDTTVIGSKTDNAELSYSTQGLKFGTHIITAKVFNGGAAIEVTTNVVLLPSQAPVKRGFSVVNTFPHDTASFTEGLEYVDGKIYESDGLKGESTLRVAELTTGKILQNVDLEPQYFAEGITVIGDKIVQLTYQEGIGFVYDKKSLKKIKEFPYQAGREGWGLCFDGSHILNTDGTNNIYFLNKDTYQKEKTLEVYDSSGAVTQLNELEFIDGKIYANIWQTDNIVVINPQTGIVEQVLDLTSLYPKESRNPEADVLNGIAWDAKGKRLFVTGKKWDKLFEIKIK